MAEKSTTEVLNSLPLQNIGSGHEGNLRDQFNARSNILGREPLLSN